MQKLEAIEAIVVNVIKEQTGSENVSSDTDLIDDEPHFDSLDFVELVMMLEERLGVEIADDEFTGPTRDTVKFRTPSAWAAFLATKLTGEVVPA